MKKEKMHPALFITFCLMLLVISACGGAETEGEPQAGEQPAEQPEGNEQASSGESVYADGRAVEIVAPAAPGSGWDLTARALAETLQQEELVDFPVPVVNENGADGAVSLAQLVTRNPEEVNKISVTSSPIMYNYLRGNSEYSYEDVTMIAQLMIDYYAVVVPHDSPYETLDDLLQAVKEDNIPIGSGADDRLPFALMVDEAGGDAKNINFVLYDGGGEISNALLNGDVQAGVSGPKELIGQVEAGQLRALTVTSEERLGGVFSDVPTAAEQGIDVVFGNWRGVMGAPDMAPEAVAFWEETIEKALQTDTWNELAESNQWSTEFKKGDEFKQFLDSSNELLRTGMEQTGELE
ncbi:tripartite tricarboxylate transporter substrate binding protein [Halalkalibacter oceani]|uniref:tripartite tricarboxylate transporter substrate binding protein n=1 Tax=Halalkalibacter oceani TaxID=1653776 RepID=UPI00339A4D48